MTDRQDSFLGTDNLASLSSLNLKILLYLDCAWDSNKFLCIPAGSAFVNII